jgi:hypothetical protein
LEPYWGKPAVRNLRGDDGNVGIIRSPLRAIVLTDQQAVRLASPVTTAENRRFSFIEALCQPSFIAADAVQTLGCRLCQRRR